MRLHISKMRPLPMQGSSGSSSASSLDFGDSSDAINPLHNPTESTMYATQAPQSHTISSSKLDTQLDEMQNIDLPSPVNETFRTLQSSFPFSSSDSGFSPRFSPGPSPFSTPGSDSSSASSKPVSPGRCGLASTERRSSGYHQYPRSYFDCAPHGHKTTLESSSHSRQPSGTLSPFASSPRRRPRPISSGSVLDGQHQEGVSTAQWPPADRTTLSKQTKDRQILMMLSGDTNPHTFALPSHPPVDPSPSTTVAGLPAARPDARRLSTDSTVHSLRTELSSDGSITRRPTGGSCGSLADFDLQTQLMLCQPILVVRALPGSTTSRIAQLGGRPTPMRIHSSPSGVPRAPRDTAPVPETPEKPLALDEVLQQFRIVGWDSQSLGMAQPSDDSEVGAEAPFRRRRASTSARQRTALDPHGSP